MSKIHQPCPDCGSSDALQQFADGGTKCYSCGKSTQGPNGSGAKTITQAPEEAIVPWRDLRITETFMPYRGHGKAALEILKVPVLVNQETGEPYGVDYKYPDGVVKRRIFPKEFRYLSGVKAKPDLYLSDRFSSGSAMAVTITEGEEDAHAAFEMLGSKYPVVSVRGSSSALQDVTAKKDYLDGFEKIYLCFDEDEPGNRARDQVALLFPFTKVFLVKKTKYKDANEYQINKAADEYKRLWFNARQHTPENVISTYAEFIDILNEPTPPAICEYPFPDLQAMTRGIRTKEFTLIKGMEGLGKTEVLGALEVHAMQTTDHNIGVIHLEEPVKRTLQRFASYDMGVPVHLDNSISPETTIAAVQNVCKRDNRLYFYKNFGGSDINAVLNQIRWLATACGCKLVFLDHITRIVTSIHGNDERADLDFISTRFSQLAEELDFAMVAITHVNDDGKTRGSRNISKEAGTVIDISRDHLSSNRIERNTTKFLLEKNRWASATGPAGVAYFDDLTFTLKPDVPTDEVGPPE